MTFFTRWFSKKQSEDYESILQSLKLEIDTCQTRLSDIRIRERRATLGFTLYTFTAWSIYVLLWYGGILPSFTRRQHIHHPTPTLEKGLKAVPVILGPILILFTRRIVQLWFKRKGSAEENHLKTLLTKQRKAIEEIKTKTNYYSTKSLIERYDEAPPSPDSSPALRRRIPNGATNPMATPPRPSGQFPSTPSQKPRPSNPLSPVQQPIPPSRRQWLDRLADAVLGDDEGSTQKHSRYALICQNCFSHNGLVRESEWETTQYRCPKCNHFNPAPKSKNQLKVQSPPNNSDLSPPRSDGEPQHSKDKARTPSPPTSLEPTSVNSNLMDVDNSMSL